MAYSLTIGAALELGTVTRERVVTDSQLFEQPMPGGSAKEMILIDIFGVVKTIELEGTFVTGQGSKTIKTFNDQFIDDTSGKIIGKQTRGTYASDTFTNSIYVLIKNYSYEYEEGSPTIIKYKLSLIQGEVL
jgi:hypothetical protein